MKAQSGSICGRRGGTISSSVRPVWAAASSSVSDWALLAFGLAQVDLQPLLVVDVGAGADPPGHTSVAVAHRQAAAEQTAAGAAGGDGDQDDPAGRAHAIDFL